MTSNSSNKIPIIVAGALGKMGSEVIKTVVNSPECELIAAVETSVEDGTDVGSALSIKNLSIETCSDFEATICNASQLNRNDNYLRRPVLVDFTHPSVVYEHCRAAIAYGVNPVIGTTGLSINQLNDLAQFSDKASVGAAVIPNFSVGMVLLQQAAAVAAAFYDHVELTELHHNQKADAPSGTCIKTAELIEESSKIFNNQVVNETETIQSVRGGKRDSGIRIHSLRLPGLVAHQEVMFGSIGETYKLIHNTIDRSAYMPGVLMTIRKVGKINHLIYGLERIL